MKTMKQFCLKDAKTVSVIDVIDQEGPAADNKGSATAMISPDLGTKYDPISTAGHAASD